MRQNIWTCKIGECDTDILPNGADAPMRRAVERAYMELTGEEPKFIFSGWGGELTEGERAAHEHRMPDWKRTELMPEDARVLLEAIDFSYPGEDRERLRQAVIRLKTLSEKELP